MILANVHRRLSREDAQLALHLHRALSDVPTGLLDRRFIVQTAYFARELSALFAQVQFRGRTA